jgi:Tol biopolymer transport system component
VSLTAGSRLGSYEITSKLGEGGMGEVYRATDTKLRRDVAIKVLPAAFTEDKERLARFEREAQLLAQLHHPNIASIFGLEESDGTRALVMELVEGPTLAERLEQGALPFNESLSVSLQIAQALEEAHEKGIVHRDLKPQNIKASIDGKVKVLDFGLAKAMDPTGAAGMSPQDLAHSPTLTLGGTREGTILGTAAYMSPEQAKGLPTDKRTDIWAFGVVVYEMLTGTQPFAAETVMETLSAVLTREIDLTKLPPATPAAVRRLLRRCLDRNPRNRQHDIADARLVLEELRDGRSSELVAPTTISRRSPARLVVAGLALVAVVAAAVFAGRKSVSPGAGAAGNAGAGFQRFTRLTFQSGLEASPSLSPDGEFVAYSASAGGDLDLFLLRVGGQRAINLSEDSPADDDHPAFSPDGRSIAFRSERAGGGLFVMGATGESVRRLTDFGDNPAWSPDGKEIVFATEGASEANNRQRNSELWIVPAAGGAPRKLFAGDAMQPAWSPSGRRIAFWAIDFPQGKGIRDVWTVAADGTDPRRVTDAPSVDWDPIWEKDGGHLVFESDRDGTMHPWRVAIDERTGSPRGEPEPVVLPTGWSGQLSLTADQSRLAFRTSEISAEIRRLPFDSETGRITGPVERLFETAISAVGLDVTADGSAIYRTAAIQEDLYVMSIDGSGLRKLTDDPAKDRGPVWSPDGRQVAFYSDRSGRYAIWTIDRDGGNLRQRTPNTDMALVPIWSPDGRSIVYASIDSPARPVYRFTLRDEPVPIEEQERIPVDPGRGEFPAVQSWSPDGRKLAGVHFGNNGQLLGDVFIYDLAARTTRFFAIPPPVPAELYTFPNLVWLPDSRRGVVRWADRILLLDTESGTLTTLLDGLPRAGGNLRLSGDRRWLYMTDTREEGDLWLASRETDARASQRGSN